MDTIIKQITLQRVVFVFALAALGALILVCATASSGTEGRLVVSFLDVGQGDAIFIQTPSGKQMLIDGGPDASVIQQLSTVMPLFDSSLDVVVATHPDKDHIAGLVDVLQQYSVDTFFMPPAIKGASSSWDDLLLELAVHPTIAQKQPFAGTRIFLDRAHGVYADIVHPFVFSDSSDTNEHSIIIKLVYGDTSFLLTGDATRMNEHLLTSIYQKSILDVDVLKLGHHGSKTSSSVSFLQATSPLYAVVSAGKANQYGHPDKAIVALVNALGIPIVSTQTNGTVTFVSDGHQITK